MKHLKLGAPIAVYCAILAVTMVGGLSAEAPQSAFDLPPNHEVVAYLLESVNWYRHLCAEREVARTSCFWKTMTQTKKRDSWKVESGGMDMLVGTSTKEEVCRGRGTARQVVYALRQIEGGKKVSEVCREMGVSPQAVYRSLGTADWDCTRFESYGNCEKRIAS
jgi:Transposase